METGRDGKPWPILRLNENQVTAAAGGRRELIMSRLKLGILGSGYLGGIIADAWKNGYLDEYELVGIAGRSEEKTKALAERAG